MDGVKRSASLLALDVVAVLAFAALGRRSHAEGVDVAGIAATAAPFLAGAVVGAALARSWRDPLAWRAGVATWLGAVVLGLALRALVLGRLPLSFAVVATVSLAVLLLGWRAVARPVFAVRARRRA